tara:strand:+ start:520 stop:1164 length:645 start_codon:yes stop_codon:yes gene_type:complete
MNKNYCIFMPTTIEVNKNSLLYKKKELMDNELRIKQYISGIQQIRDLNPDIEIYISDNSNYLNKPSNILDIIQQNKIKIIKNTPNKYGHINKGSGLLENWQYNLSIIEKYEYIIHFEPRQLLKSNYFIDTFLKNPSNLFTLGSNKIHFNTGLFCLKSIDLLKFIKQVHPNDLIQNNSSIEYILYQYIHKNNISYEVLDKMDLLWFFPNKPPLHH